MINVLVTGRAIPNRIGYSTAEQLVEGFKQAGHNAFFYGNFYQQHYNWLGVKDLQSIDKIDLWIYTEMNDGDPQYGQLFNYFKLKNTPTLYQDYDVSYQPERNLAFAKSLPFASYLVANRLFFDKFAELGKPILFSPYGFSPHIHRILPEVAKEHMFGFIGSITPERQELINQLESLGEKVYVTQAFGEDLIRETNKIHIMLHRQQGGCKGLMPGRPTETMGAGTMILTHNDDMEDIRVALPLVPFLSYGSEEDLKSIIKMTKEGVIPSIARSAHMLVNKYHTYKVRAESIVKFCRGKQLL